MGRILITAIKYGESTFGEDNLFYGGDPNKSQPISFVAYLLRTKERLIMVDTGCVTMPGWNMEHFCGPINILSQLNISPLDITDVVITHAHHDHIELVSEYKNAVVHIQEDEYELGKKYIDNNMKVNIFDSECDVCEGVKAIKIGGHSVGSCIVCVNTDGKEYVIAGDECYVPDCIINQVPTGCFVCLEKSRAFVKDYKDANLLFCHDGAYLPGQSGFFNVN